MARPFGYENDRTTIREEEAAVVRQAADRVVAGESLRSIVASMNSEGTPTAQDGEWYPVQLRRILVSPRVAGKVAKGERFVKASWPAIVDDVTWKRVKTALTESSRTTGGPPIRRVYLLTGGLAVCGLCGQPLIARPSGKQQRAYVCTSAAPIKGCGKIRMLADPLEDRVVTDVLARLSTPASVKKVKAALKRSSSDMGAARTQLEDVETKLSHLARDYGESKITRDEWQAARAPLVDRQKKLSKLANGEIVAELPAESPEALIEWWNDADLSQKRALLDALVSRVVVHPATNRGSHLVDLERVEIVWK